MNEQECRGCEVPMKHPARWAAVVLALSSACFSLDARAAVEVTITADNAYVLGWGDADSINNHVGPFINTTAAEIVSCSTGVEHHTISGTSRGEYLYVAAWSDDAVKQGLIGQFKAGPAHYAYTGVGDWQACATGFDFDSSAPPLSGAPGSDAINSQIAACNAGTGSPTTTSAGWVGLTGGSSGNLAYGETNTNGGAYDAIACLDTAARWMWFNAIPPTVATTADPFQTNPTGGGGHKEYLIFRLPVNSIFKTCGDGVLDAGEQCDDGNLDENDCCSDTCTTPCDDDDPCTVDSCDAVTGCTHEPAACDDLNPCTVDSCSPGVGCTVERIDCNDGNACTADSCDEESGACLYEPIPCFDSDICTADSCDPDTGCVFAPTSPCTEQGYERCHLAVIDATIDYAAAEIKARSRCEDLKLSDRLAPETDCMLDGATNLAVAKARAKLQAVVQKSCDDPSRVGWPAMCPDFEGLGCGSIAITDAAGLTSCLSCIQRSIIEQALRLYYSGVNATASQEVLDRCQRTIGKSTSRYLTSRTKALGQCYANRIDGSHANECPAPGDGRSASAVRKAAAKVIKKISKACAPVSPVQLGFNDLCPGVGVCAGPIHDMMDLIECVECVSTFKADCLMNAAILPRQPYTEECLAPVGPCDDGLECTIDALVEYTEESETTSICDGGDKDGQACESSAECPNGTCVPIPEGGQACDGGLRDGAPCSMDAECFGGDCSLTFTGPELAVEQQCTHTPQTGDEFGNWRWICAGGTKADYPCTTSGDCDGGGTCINASPCCEDDSDCEYPEPDPSGTAPDPCLVGSCATATHRCVFEKLDESDCADEDVPEYTPPISTAPCAEPAPAGQLCHLTAAVDAPPPVNLFTMQLAASTDALLANGTAVAAPNMTPRFAGIPRTKPHFADIHVHMFAEESWVAKTLPFGRWRWVYDDVGTVTSSSDSCDGGFLHARVRTIKPILEKFEDCLIPFADTAIGDYLVNAACSEITPWCPAVRELLEEAGPLLMSEQMSKTEGTRGDAGLHLARRHPGSGWPRWDTVAHHKVKAAELKTATERGLKLIVVMATGTRGLCELLPPKDIGIPFTPYQVDLPFDADSCDEMAAVDRQIDAAKQFVTDNSSWVQIVTTPEEAEDVINGDKLAMVLSIETTELFRNLESTIRSATQPSMMRQAIKDELKKYYDKGVRSLHIAHMTDSLFAGAAESNFAGSLLQFMHEPYGNDCHYENIDGKHKIGFDVTREWDEPAQAEIFKNEVGLRPAGEILIEEMMNLGMLIDLSHSSEKTIQRVWELAYAGLPAQAGRTNAGPYYPFHFSHARFREVVTPKEATEYTVPGWVVQRVRRVGGMVGLRTNGDEMRQYWRTPWVDNNCAGSSRSFAQLFRFGAEGLKVPISLGTDLMTLGQYPRPRFRDNGLPGKPRTNRNGACAAGFRVEGICQARVQEGAGQIDEDYDTLGLASVSEEMDLIEDLKEVGMQDPQLEKLKNSAEDFIRMWKRSTGVRSGPAALANVGTGPQDLDLWHVGKYVPIKKRKKDYNLHIPCFRRYCENSQFLGQDCLFDGECQPHMLCGGPTLCGTNYGVCVCTKNGGCPLTEWCKLGIPILAFDNTCKAQKENGEKCHADRQCKSIKCKWFKCKA